MLSFKLLSLVIGPCAEQTTRSLFEDVDKYKKGRNLALSCGWGQADDPVKMNLTYDCTV